MTTRLVLSRADLAAAVDAVRFAVGNDPDCRCWPACCSSRVRRRSAGHRPVPAGDRPRDGRVDGPPARVLAPAAASTSCGPCWTPAQPPQARLTVAAGTVSVSVAGPRPSSPSCRTTSPTTAGCCPAGGRRARQVAVDVAPCGAACGPRSPVTRGHDGLPLPVTVLGLDGRAGCGCSGRTSLPGRDRAYLLVGVNGAYLLDALEAAGGPPAAGARWPDRPAGRAPARRRRDVLDPDAHSASDRADQPAVLSSASASASRSGPTGRTPPPPCLRDPPCPTGSGLHPRPAAGQPCLGCRR